MEIIYSKAFTKSLKKCPLKIVEQFRAREEIFLANRRHPLLRSHPLSGRLVPFRSFNVTGDWRVIYLELSDNKVLFYSIGTHSQLYK